MPLVVRINAVVVSVLMTCVALPASSGPKIGKPPMSPDKPMVTAPIRGLEVVDEELHQYLARCDDGRPICETGMPCYGWAQIALTIDSDGRPRNFRVASSCPGPSLPPETWGRLFTWRFNPREVGGRAVPFESWVILAHFLGVSS